MEIFSIKPSSLFITKMRAIIFYWFWWIIMWFPELILDIHIYIYILHIYVSYIFPGINLYIIVVFCVLLKVEHIMFLNTELRVNFPILQGDFFVRNHSTLYNKFQNCNFRHQIMVDVEGQNLTFARKLSKNSLMICS